MKLFEEPKVEVVTFAVEDVITASTANEEPTPEFFEGGCF